MYIKLLYKIKSNIHIEIILFQYKINHDFGIDEHFDNFDFDFYFLMNLPFSSLLLSSATFYLDLILGRLIIETSPLLLIWSV